VIEDIDGDFSCEPDVFIGAKRLISKMNQFHGFAWDPHIQKDFKELELNRPVC